jgi:hypothetical protein
MFGAIEIGQAKFDLVFMNSFLIWRLFIPPIQDAVRTVIAASVRDLVRAQPILEVLYC